MAPEPTDEIRIEFDAQQKLVGDLPPVKCGFCGTPSRGKLLHQGMLAGGFGWNCPCGARGLHAPLYDLDELYEDVLVAWGLDSRTPDHAPAVPVGESGLLFASYVDGDSLLAQLFAEARQQRAQVAATRIVAQFVMPGHTPPAWTWDVLWARPRPLG
ncbi:hypothetical protein OV208_33085 [Corallococcus sp. bb12-1]|uniref:hypothetical protein n=1 Tax=Corallococcus sp. bb12-1 TaxID=2996784 RepID=UPI00226E4203|nr:hypothetical protein [Corallococcus sp. bb12-1]MCY1046193.1 hypothetical protein [Corallococcus sp. bb12-1]